EDRIGKTRHAATLSGWLATGLGPLLPLPACGYRMHTFQKPTLLQRVTGTPPLSHPVSPQSIQVTLMTHFFHSTYEQGRIRCVHTIAACGERSEFARSSRKFRVRGPLQRL